MSEVEQVKALMQEPATAEAFARVLAVAFPGIPAVLAGGEKRKDYITVIDRDGTVLVSIKFLFYVVEVKVYPHFVRAFGHPITNEGLLLALHGMVVEQKETANEMVRPYRYMGRIM